MAYFFGRHYFEKNTVGGQLSNQTSSERGLLRHIIVEPTTSSTTFDFAISDGSSLNLYSRESITGILNESVEIPVQSALFVRVSGATNDEKFKIYLAVQEL